MEEIELDPGRVAGGLLTKIYTLIAFENYIP